MTTIQEQIAQAKAAGYDDAAITKHLSGLPEYSGKVKTALDAGYQPSDILGYLAPMTVTAKRENVQPEKRKYELSEVPLAAVKNLPKSAKEFAGSIYEAVTSPVQTIKGVGQVIGGGAIALLPKEAQDFIVGIANDPEKVKQSVALAQSVGGMFKDRYGDAEKIKRTVAEDPVGAFSDLSALFTGGSVAAAKVAPATSKVLGTAAKYTDPLSAVVTAAPVIAQTGQKVAEGVSSAAGKVIDMRQIPSQKAANILRQSIGGEMDAVVNALRNAKPGQTPADALAQAGLNEPVTQALLKRMSERDPKFFTDLLKTEDFKTANALAQIAGGETAAAARGTVKNMKNALNTVTTPQAEAALTRANLGKAVADYEAQAGKLSSEAAAKVQEVRDLINAGNKAEAYAKLQVIKQGLPTSTARYTYADGLAQKAFNEWSDAAAKGSLDLGQGALMAQSAADTLRKFKIKPLTGDSITSAINAKLADPKIGPNKEVATGLKMIADDIAEWTGNGGVIDAQALHTIRKSVNTRIQSLMPGADANAQKRAAAKIMSQVNPLIDNAIEAAGGTGWKKYLADYSKGMQNINARKLSGEARNLYRDSPDTFVKLVENNSPEVVEKFMGPNNYDLAVELSQDAMKTLESAGKQITTRAEVARQATAGEKALVDLMSEHTSILKIPNWFDPRITTTNKALDIIERKVSKKTLEKLTTAAKTAQNFEDLLNTLPASERNIVLKAIKDPKIWESVGKGIPKVLPEKTRRGVAASANALAREPEENNNALVQ